MVEFDRESGVTAQEINSKIEVSLKPRATHVSQAETNIEVVQQIVRTMIASILYSHFKNVLIYVVIGATIVLNTLSRSKLAGLLPRLKKVSLD